MEQFNAGEYEICDAHCHIFPEKISEKAAHSIGDFYGLPMFASGSADALLDSGKEIGVSRYLVCSTATTCSQVESINMFIYKECMQNHEFLGFGTLHPDMENIGEETEHIITMGLRGVKLHPDFQKFNIDSENAYKIYDAIQGRLPVLIHMGDDRYDFSSPARLKRVLGDFPRLKVLAAHFGGYRRWEEAAQLLKGEKNVMFDTCSTLGIIKDPEYAKKLVYHYGVDKMFFGTDFPMWSHKKELERFMAVGLTDEENRLILSENFKHYFHLT